MYCILHDDSNLEISGYNLVGNDLPSSKKRRGVCIYHKSYHLCDFVVRDIKITVYLESPRKINFNLVSDFLSK